MSSSDDNVRLTVTRLQVYELVEGELLPSIEDELESGERLLDVEGAPREAAAEAADWSKAAGYDLGAPLFESVLNRELPAHLTVITSRDNLLVTTTAPEYPLPSPSAPRSEGARGRSPGHPTMGDRPSDRPNPDHSAG